MMLRDLKNRIISRPNPYTLPEWKLPFFPRSCGETTSILDTEIHGGGEKTFVQINWCTSGCGQVSIDGGDEFTVRTGDVFYSLPGNSRKNAGTEAPWKLRWLTFDGPCAADFIRSYDYPIHLKNAGRCPEELFQEFERGLKENSLISLRRLVGIITEILSLIGGIHDDSTPEARLIRCFIETVRDHYMQSQVNVNIIAEMLGVHRSTLSRILTEKMNTSPGRYLLQVRIQRALSLLRNTDLPVHVISRKVGLPDPAHFARLIHSATGMSPSAFRRAAVS